VQAAAAFFALTGFWLQAPSQAAAQEGNDPKEGTDYGRLTIIEENDSIYLDDDRYYTQGAQFTWLSPSVGADSAFHGPFEALSGGHFDPFRGGG